MELGTYQSWNPQNQDLYADLNIKWFGCGFSAEADTAEAISQLKDIQTTIDAGGIPFIKWVCDARHMKEKVADQFFSNCERDFRWMAKNIPAKHFEIFPEPSCPLVTGRELLLADYIEVLRIANETFKAVDPGIQVWNGGIGFFRTLWSLFDFFEDGLPLTDALNLHPFMHGNTWGQIAARISNLLLEAQWTMETQRQVKPIIVTEWGVPTEWRDTTTYESFVDRAGVPALSADGQAQAFIEVLEQFRAIGCPVFCFAALRDEPLITRHWSGHVGFVNPDGSDKPSRAAVKEWVAEEVNNPTRTKEIRGLWTSAPSTEPLDQSTSG